MLRKISFLTCFLLMSAGPVFASSAVNVPDWVRDAAAKPTGRYPAETKAVILLDDESVTVTGPGQVEVLHRRIVRLLRPEGRDYRFLSVHLENNDKLVNIHAWTVDSAGRQYEVKDKDFLEASPYTDILYVDIRFRRAEAPAAEPGSVIAFEYSVKRHLWMDQYHWIFQEQDPVEEARFTLQMPSGWEYKAAFANQPAKEPAALGSNRFQWTRHNLPGIEEEKMRPDDDALVGHMELSFYEPGGNVNLASWRAIGDWYYRLTDGRRNANPEIVAKVQQLTAGAHDFETKVRILTEFIQSEVRYVEISIGIGGFQPHPATDVFRYRYGDCKDKATLLSALLQSAGISSDYVLVDTERGVTKADVPSTWFNHAILAIVLPNDVSPAAYNSVVTTKSGARYLIFDPTDEYTPVGRIRSALQGSYALLVTKNGGELVQLPVLQPDTNRYDRDGKFVLTADGSLIGTVTETFTGDHANRQRRLFAHSNESEREKEFDLYLNASLKNVVVQQMKVENLAARDKEIMREYKFSTKSYAQHTGALMLVRVRILGEKGFRVDWSKRKYPVELHGTTAEKDSYEIEVPGGYVIDDLPEAQQIDVGFASYKSKVETDGSKIHYSREYIIREFDIGPDKFADLRKLEQVIGSDEYASAVLKKKP
jgi:hypothetical protein